MTLHSIAIKVNFLNRFNTAKPIMDPFSTKRPFCLHASYSNDTSILKIIYKILTYKYLERFPHVWEKFVFIVLLQYSCWAWITFLSYLNTERKVSKYGVISGPYFPAFGLNTEGYFVSLHIQSKCGKIRTRNNSVFGHFSRSESDLHHDRSMLVEAYHDSIVYLLRIGWSRLFHFHQKLWVLLQVHNLLSFLEWTEIPFQVTHKKRILSMLILVSVPCDRF